MGTSVQLRRPLCRSRSGATRERIPRRARRHPPARAVVAVLVLAAVAAAGCEYLGKKAQSAPPAPPPSVVQVVEVSAQTVKLQSEWVAQTYSQDAVEVRARVNGYIEERRFNAGNLVKQGDILYRLDDRPYKAQVDRAKGELGQRQADLQFAKDQVQVLEAQAQLEQARAEVLRQEINVNRLVPLVAADAAPQQSLDDARQFLAAAQATFDARKANLDQTKITTRTQIDAKQGSLEAARAALGEAELNLGYATIRAQISGRVGDTTVEVGGLATSTASQPLTTIVPLDPISVRFNVSEVQYLNYIQTGGTRESGRLIPLRLVLADGRLFPKEGRIKRELNRVDSRTGTFELQADFPNPDGWILPGQFGRVRARIREQKDAVLVPQRAVFELQGTRSVMVVGPDDKAAQRTVTMGDRIGELWIATEGLKPGDRVVVEGLQKARPGAVVKPQSVPLPPVKEDLPELLFQVPPAAATGPRR